MLKVLAEASEESGRSAGELTAARRYCKQFGEKQRKTQRDSEREVAEGEQ